MVIPSTSQIAISKENETEVVGENAPVLNSLIRVSIRSRLLLIRESSGLNSSINLSSISECPATLDKEALIIDAASNLDIFPLGMEPRHPRELAKSVIALKDQSDELIRLKVGIFDSWE